MVDLRQISFVFFSYSDSTSGSVAFSTRQPRPSIAAVFAATRTPIGRNLSPENQGRNGTCTATSVTVTIRVQSSAKAHSRSARIDQTLRVIHCTFLLPKWKKNIFCLQSVCAVTESGNFPSPFIRYELFDVILHLLNFSKYRCQPVNISLLSSQRLKRFILTDHPARLQPLEIAFRFMQILQMGRCFTA